MDGSNMQITMVSPWFHHGFTIFSSAGKAARVSVHAAPRTGSLHQRHGRLGLVGSIGAGDGETGRTAEAVASCD